VLTLEEARATALVAVDVPGSGLASFRVEPSDRPAAPSTAFAPATATARALSNGLLEVAIAADGTLDVTGADGTELHGVGRLVDGGDRGDSYNYAPPARDVLVSEPTEVAVELIENGPLRARTRVTRVYEWPTALSSERDLRSGRTVPTPVETLVEVRAGEPFVRISTSFLNQSADHRLRFHVPLPEPAAVSASAGQFAVTERGLTAEGGWGEYPIPTFPASSFVSAGAANVLLDHATEYELVGDGSELALTLLRAIGSISVNIHPLRDEPAASEIPTPGAQDLGVRIENRFAVVPAATGWQGAHAVALAEDFRNDVLVARGTAPAAGQLPPDTTGVQVDGADILVSSVRRVADDDRGAGIEVRLTAMSDTGSTARVTGAFTEATTVDLLGRPLSTAPVTDGLELALGPWEIRTVVVR
jgi:alpha-mannosidase